jgi:hypothetical protein
LQAEYENAPNFSFSKRVKLQVAEDIVRLEGRRAEYVRKLNALNHGRRARPQVHRATSARVTHGPSPNASRKATLQSMINTLRNEIGSVGEEISRMGFTEERRELVHRHQDLIRTRRDLIRQVNEL